MGILNFKPLRTGNLEASVTLKGLWLRGVRETDQAHISVDLEPEQALDLLSELLSRRETLLHGLHPGFDLSAYPCPTCHAPVRMRFEIAGYSGFCGDCGREIALDLEGLER